MSVDLHHFRQLESAARVRSRTDSLVQHGKESSCLMLFYLLLHFACDSREKSSGITPSIFTTQPHQSEDGQSFGWRYTHIRTRAARTLHPFKNS